MNQTPENKEEKCCDKCWNSKSEGILHTCPCHSQEIKEVLKDWDKQAEKLAEVYQMPVAPLHTEDWAERYCEKFGLCKEGSSLNDCQCKEELDFISKVVQAERERIKKLSSSRSQQNDKPATPTDIISLWTKDIQRIEIVNHSKKGVFGRAFTYWSEYGNGVENPEVEIEVQDRGKTLKLFIK